MAASETSLRVTDLYRDRLSAIRERVQGNAERRWPGIEDFDTKADAWLAATAAELAGAQREAVRATQGFLAAFLSSELGQRTQAPSLNPDRYLISRDGRPLNQALNTALVGARVALKAGDDYRQGLTRAVRMIERDLMNAARTALNDGMKADERVVGWQRGVAGTCGACGGDIAKEVSVNLPELPLNIHPNCKCVTVPVVTRGPLSKSERARLGKLRNLSYDDAATDYARELLHLSDDALRRIDALGVNIELSGTKTLDQLSRGATLRDIAKNMGAVSKGDWVAVGRLGKTDSLLHEIGHFLDKTAGLRRGDLEAFRTTFMRGPAVPASHKWKMPGGSGNAEMWADTFRAYIKGGKKGVADLVRPYAKGRADEYAKWAAKEVERLLKR